MVWFKSYDEEYRELLRHLTGHCHWEMEPQYAKAFLGAYKKSIGKMLAKGRARSDQLRNSPDPEISLMAFTLAADEDLALVGQAYQAYMLDLRRGRHVGSDVEKAIWAILVNCADLVSDLDKGFSNYIDENHEQLFPRLLDEVFTRFDENQRESTREPDLVFAGTFPDSDSCTPVRLKFGDFVISYYENPKTIGEKVGVPPLYTYPYVAVVTAPGKSEYELIVRVEDGGFDAPMLCSLDATGVHRNFGVWSPADRDDFVRKAAEIASQSDTFRDALGTDKELQRVVITCPSCGSSLRVPRSQSGKIRCPSCRNLFDAAT